MECNPQNTEKTARKIAAGLYCSIRKEPVLINIIYKEKEYTGEGIPTPQTCKEDKCNELGITLNEENLGIIHCTDKGWKMKNVKDQKLVDAIGNEIALWYAEEPKK